LELFKGERKLKDVAMTLLGSYPNQSVTSQYLQKFLHVLMYTISGTDYIILVSTFNSSLGLRISPVFSMHLAQFNETLYKMLVIAAGSVSLRLAAYRCPAHVAYSKQTPKKLNLTKRMNRQTGWHI
jgi:hypothetical protein